MQDTRRTDMKLLEGGVLKEAEETIKADHVGNNPETDSDSATALQLFLDRIPINNSIPGIKNSPVVELKTGDTVKDAIEFLYSKNAFGAPIVDVLDPEIPLTRFPYRYIGFLDFATLVLWSLQNASKETGKGNFVSLLEKNPETGHTKVGELAKSFLWNPFFPVRLDDTLFHVLLLISKHRIRVVPVIEQSNLKVTGFVTQVQNAVIQLLLQSDGLTWFDSIAEKPLSEFRFENESVSFVYGDESIADALHVLFKSQTGAVAVIDRQTRMLIGSVRNGDVYLLLENEKIFRDRKVVTVEEFIRIETSNQDPDPTIERDMGALLSAGVLQLRNKYRPRMDSPVTNKKTDTLKEAMKNVARTKSDFCFQVDDSQHLLGILTLRDIILQFSPPSMNSNIDGGGFFETTLDLTGCQIKGGTLVCDH
ncbi:SNF1-related protein kinase regulatory subunit gamma-1 isoform X1 [Gossypium hirsutum]|uniref:SNF1-related protein kinase regulatory subunit gamma-1 isoform X1 n=1 Tax=Gossypium hirsutum TaxID=3635 RepID=A0ABM3AUT6_GOSHI|nr:SNF1-related protein kinase regulatory subunit gamma-1-like isoform X1 [Gossypium hirsutum]